MHVLRRGLKALQSKSKVTGHCVLPLQTVLFFFAACKLCARVQIYLREMGNEEWGARSDQHLKGLNDLCDSANFDP